MQQSIHKDRFIPLRKNDLLSVCLSENKLEAKDKEAFASLCKIMVSTLHFEYHQTLEVLKDSYAPFDPNTSTLEIDEISPVSLINDAQTSSSSNSPASSSSSASSTSTSTSTLINKQRIFAEAFAGVLNAANFEQITEQDLQDALQEESLFKVRLAVEFDDFAEIVFYRRGEYKKTETISKFWGLKKQTISFTNYDKVAVYIKFKDAQYFQNSKRSMTNFAPSSTIIKLFQNVPKADLEMLFPNSEVRMRVFDKLIIGGSAVVGGTVVLVTKLGASLLLIGGLVSYWVGYSDQEVTIGNKELLALGLGAGVLGGFIFKEWSKFKNRKLKFMKALADNLYFKNLDNNAGVFHHLIDAAEEEECKESILAYYCLLTSAHPLSKEQLDATIEQWFANKFDFHIDFEIDDALAKLTRFGIVNYENKLYTAKPIECARKILDEKWDSLFT